MSPSEGYLEFVTAMHSQPHYSVVCSSIHAFMAGAAYMAQEFARGESHELKELQELIRNLDNREKL